MERLILTTILGLLGPAILPYLHSQDTIEEENVLFFTARADQTNSENGGVAIWSFATDSWRWWFQGITQANVSPDGKQVAYIFSDRLHITDVGAQNAKVINADNAATPKWSPQGDHIAYSAGDGQFNRTLKIITPEGTLVKEFPEFFASGFSGFSWSPDGKQIAFLKDGETTHPGCDFFPLDQVVWMILCFSKHFGSLT